MKTIALSMIFSLAVIVCEQQTLFAPHYTTYGGTSLVASKTSAQNSLVPIAGVNRSVPLAGSGNGVISAATEFVKNDIWVLDTGAGLPSKNDIWIVDTGVGLTGNGLQPIADPNMQNSDPTQSDPRHPEPTQTGPILHGPINGGCPPCDLELRLGLSGTAGPD